MDAPALLVLLPHNPGDVVMGLQALRRVKAAHPELAADYVVSEECRGLVEGSPLIRKAMVLPRRALQARWDAGDDAGLMAEIERFVSGLRATRYALSANLYQERAGGLLQGFVDADRKIGLEFRDGENFQVRGRWMEHLFAVPADRASNPFHAVDIYVRAMLAALDAAPTPLQAALAMPVLPPLIRPVAARDLAPGEYLAFHPGSAWAGKRWPEDHWARLAGRCAAAGFVVALTGAPEEKPLAERIVAAVPPGARGRIVDLAGATTLIGSAWVQAHARLAIAGDTVAMHLAAAAGTPVLALFGPSNPVETGPYGRGHLVIQTGMPAAPGLALDRAHPGLSRLGPDEVAAWVLEGELPAGHAVWETAWDAGCSAQVLVDARRRPHPAWERGLPLARVLDAGIGTRFSGGTPAPGSGASAPHDPRVSLRRLLVDGVEISAERAPGAGYLRRLAAAERALEADTRHDLVWEAYRIAANGLPLRDVRGHLRARLDRLDSALDEESALHAGCAKGKITLI